MNDNNESEQIKQFLRISSSISKANLMAYALILISHGGIMPHSKSSKFFFLLLINFPRLYTQKSKIVYLNIRWKYPSFSESKSQYTGFVFFFILSHSAGSCVYLMP